MPSFLAMIWDTTDVQADRAAHLQMRRFPAAPPECEYREDGFVLIDLAAGCNVGRIIRVGPLPGGPGGAVYGTLFRKSDAPSGTPRLSQLPAPEAARLVASGGQSIFADCWGSYVAFIRTGTEFCVIADPAASIPCCYAASDGVTLVFSHLESCVFLDRARFSVNDAFIARLLVYDKIQNGETGLNEVRELMGGERLRVCRSGLVHDLAWDPRSVARDVRFVPAPQAAAELAATCEHVVKSWASCFQHVSVSLSGGLDSAVVLACLDPRSAFQNVSAFHNLLGSDDLPELGFAAEAADMAGIALCVIPSDPAITLPEVGTHPLSVRPLRAFLAPVLPSPFGSDLAAPPVPALFTGQGGDHLFLARRTSLAFADYLFHFGRGGNVVDQLFNASRLSGYSIWKVIEEAAASRKSVRGGGMYAAVLSRQANMSGFSPGTTNMDNSFPDWAAHAPGLPPLKFIQLAGLAHLYQVRDRLVTKLPWQVVDPLISQPLIEFCLRTPTYVLCQGGVSRGLVREAFRGRIPESIRRRTGKGSASGYFADNMKANHGRIVAALQDGELVRRGLLLPEDVLTLSDLESPRVRALGRTLLIWYAIEAWLQSWKAAGCS